ncbi:hypothetical protein M9435_000413 [Picochlorum sp. BPE23]|nr:hypothetical protein M9435_000413 [Picochlorum sp. BPE23]
MGSVDDWAQGVVSRRSPPPPPPPSPPPPPPPLSPLLTTSGSLRGDATYVIDNTVQLNTDVSEVKGLVYWEGVLGLAWQASFQFKANGTAIPSWDVGADAVWFFAYRETNNLHDENQATTGYNFVADEYQNEYQLIAPGLSTVASPPNGIDLGDDTWRTMEITFSSDGTTDTIVMTVDGSQVITQSHDADIPLKYLEPTYYGFGGRTGTYSNSHYVRNFQIVRT